MEQNNINETRFLFKLYCTVARGGAESSYDLIGASIPGSVSRDLVVNCCSYKCY